MKRFGHLLKIKRWASSALYLLLLFTVVIYCLEYIIVITPADGDPSVVSVNSDQESITLPRPAASFSVTVLAANNAGQGIIQEAGIYNFYKCIQLAVQIGN